MLKEMNDAIKTHYYVACKEFLDARVAKGDFGKSSLEKENAPNSTDYQFALESLQSLPPPQKNTLMRPKDSYGIMLAYGFMKPSAPQENAEKLAAAKRHVASPRRKICTWSNRNDTRRI